MVFVVLHKPSEMKDDYFNNINVMLVTQSCPTLCHLMDCSPPDSSVHGILQARILEWVAIPFSRGSSQPRNRSWVSCIAGRFFTLWVARGKYQYWLPFMQDLLGATTILAPNMCSWGLWSQIEWVQIPPLILTGSVTLSKLVLGLWVPIFLSVGWASYHS